MTAPARRKLPLPLAYLSIVAGALVSLLFLSMCSCGHERTHGWPRREWTDKRGITHSLIVPPGDGAEEFLEEKVAIMKRKYPEVQR